MMNWFWIRWRPDPWNKMFNDDLSAQHWNKMINDDHSGRYRDLTTARKTRRTKENQKKKSVPDG